MSEGRKCDAFVLGHAVLTDHQSRKVFGQYYVDIKLRREVRAGGNTKVGVTSLMASEAVDWMIIQGKDRLGLGEGQGQNTERSPHFM